MNQEEFLELIKNKDVIDILNIIKDLLEQDDSRLNIPDGKKIKTNMELIQDNFESIIKNINDGGDIFFIKKSINDSKLREILLNKLDIVIKVLRGKRRNYDILSFSVVAELFEEGGTEFLEAFIKNIKNILPNIDVDDLFEVCQLVKKAPSYNEEISEILNDELNRKRKEVSKSLLKKLGSGIYDRQINIDMIDIILDELMENEGIRMIDIEYIGKGAFSKTYKIGEMVLKIGRSRRCYEIQNHPRILQPLVRKNIKNNRGFVNGCIEVANFVETIRGTELGIEEELYQLYKELRKDGLIWADAGYKNVGRLKKKNDNIYYVKRNGDEPINVAPEAVGLKGELKDRVLNKGELVILDSDYIFNEDEPDMTLVGDMTEMLEERYQREIKGITMEGMNYFYKLQTKENAILDKEHDER